MAPSSTTRATTRTNRRCRAAFILTPVYNLRRRSVPDEACRSRTYVLFSGRLLVAERRRHRWQRLIPKRPPSRNSSQTPSPRSTPSSPPPPPPRRAPPPAPVRRAPDFSGLPPAEKIKVGLEERQRREGE